MFYIQGYLSRALCKSVTRTAGTVILTDNIEGDARNVDVLALDSSPQWAEASSRMFQKSKSKGILTYRTIWLGEGPSFGSHPGLQDSEPENRRGLEEPVEEWIDTLSHENETKAVPVVFVALHACGSLTPAILQEVLSNRLNHTSSRGARGAWSVAGAIVVGCCYNLMGKQGLYHAKEMTVRKLIS